MGVYIKASDGLAYKASATATTAASAVGVALNNAAPSQPVTYVSAGPVNFGTTTITAGQVYVVGATAGNIHPVADATTGWLSSRLGWGYSTTVFVVDIKNSGIAFA